MKNLVYFDSTPPFPQFPFHNSQKDVTMRLSYRFLQKFGGLLIVGGHIRRFHVTLATLPTNNREPK